MALLESDSDSGYSHKFSTFSGFRHVFNSEGAFQKDGRTEITD
jgi:hypothetical protein